MNRPIKFRGRVRDENKARSDQGNLVYGNCLHQYPNGKVALSHTIKLALTFVDPDSVAQLVGYDANDNEVYEDDVLIDQKGREYTISDVIQVELFCGGVYEPLYSTRYKFTLKEGKQ